MRTVLAISAIAIGAACSGGGDGDSEPGPATSAAGYSTYETPLTLTDDIGLGLPRSDDPEATGQAGSDAPAEPDHATNPPAASPVTPPAMGTATPPASPTPAQPEPAPAQPAPAQPAMPSSGAQIDPNCPVYMNDTVDIPGCCMPEGVCGVISSLSNECITESMFLADLLPGPPCVPAAAPPPPPAMQAPTPSQSSACEDGSQCVCDQGRPVPCCTDLGTCGCTRDAPGSSCREPRT